MEQEITAHFEGEAHRPDRLQVFLTRSFAAAAAVAFGVFAVPYALGVTVEQAEKFCGGCWVLLVILGLGVLTVWSYWCCERVLGALVDHYSARMAVVRTVFTVLGVCCFLGFYGFAVVGIRRGHTMRGDWPLIILAEGLILLATVSWPLHRMNRVCIGLTITQFLFVPPVASQVWFCIILLLTTPLLVLIFRLCRGVLERQGRQYHPVVFAVLYISITLAFIRLVYRIAEPPMVHFLVGRSYYRWGRYEEALPELEMASRSWSDYVLYESLALEKGRALDMLAKTYCQLGRFDDAGQTYRLMEERCSDSRSSSARWRLGRLEHGLAAVRRYETWVASGGELPYNTDTDPRLSFNDWSDLCNVALVYRDDLQCEAKALEVYKRMLGFDLSEDRRKAVSAMIRELEGKGRGILERLTQ